MYMASSHISRPHPFSALAISPGIAIGPAYLFIAEKAAATSHMQIEKVEPERVETELQRLHSAIDAASAELHALSIQVAKTVGPEEAAIFEAQEMMLQDPEMLDEMQQLIVEQYYSAISALQSASEHQAQELESLGDELLSARAVDVRDAAARAVRSLSGSTQTESSAQTVHTAPVILCANDLTPSDTAGLDPQTILGICTVAGGPTTHAAILARALEIPAIAGIDVDLLESLQHGQTIAIDGSQGLFYFAPNEEQQQLFRQTMQRQQEERATRRESASQWRNRQGSTSDGIAIEVFANVGDSDSARAAGEAGAQGIGLLRTEFLFGGRPIFPDEREQLQAYTALFQAFLAAQPLGKTIIARTLDAGADKPFPALEPLIGALHEANPALGLRGARIHLVHEELLRQQLRALLCAAAQTGIQLNIMFPMIATLEEVRRLKAIYATVRQELQAEGLSLVEGTQVGIMVETPAAAVMADVLAREVDFFSIGANDLFQYTLAADRTNSRVMGMFGLLEPSVWRLIAQVARAGNAHGKLVALCGELASDPRIAPLLAGLGLRELSMNPAAIPRVKAVLHAQPMAYWQQLAQQLLEAETAADVQAVLQYTA
jgi:phosphoenolpyruvate-protein phosphotransferase